MESDDLVEDLVRLSKIIYIIIISKIISIYIRIKIKN